MAIEINKSNENTNYEIQKLATQGSVVNTIKSYNEQIIKEYNDKNTDTLNNNTLQKSLSTVVKALDKSNNISETFEQGISVEDLNTDNTGLTPYGDSGFLRRLDILAKAITPKGADISKWGDDISANNISNSEKNDETTPNVPVIAFTKGYEKNVYETNKDFSTNFNLSKGLEYNSHQFVLSEKQIRDMVITVSRDIIEDYTIRLIQMRDMIKSNNAKLLGILNYIIKSNSPYKDYFPVSVGYNEDLENNKKFYEFVTLNSTKIEIESSAFTNNNDKLFLTINKETKDLWYSAVEVNDETIATLCNITLIDGRFLVKETTSALDEGYELLLTNYPIYIIIDSDIDLDTMDYEIKINGNPRKVVSAPSDVYPSETRSFRYKVGLLSLEGQDINIEFPYTMYKEKEFKDATFKIDNKVITKDESVFLRDIITDINIKVDISDANTKKITYFSGYEN